MSKKILGLDIRSNSIAAVVVLSSFSGNEIESFSYLTIDSIPSDQDPLESLIGPLADNLKSANTVCMISLPAEAISYRNMQVPFKENKKIRQILPFELEPSLPFPIDDQVIDFTPFPFPNGNQDSAQTPIIAMSVEKMLIDRYIQTLKQMGIDPTLVTIGGLCCALLLLIANQEASNFIFLDIDNHKTTLFIIQKKEVSLIRTFFHKNHGRLDPVQLKSDARRTILSFEQMYHCKADPEAIYINGLSADESDKSLSIQSGIDMTSIFSDLYDVPVISCDVAQTMNIPIKNSPDNWIPEKLNDALALALSEPKGIKPINFRKGSIAARKYWAEYKKDILNLCVPGILVILMIIFNLSFDAIQTSNRLKQLDRQMAMIFNQTFPEVKNLRDPLTQIQHFKSKISELKSKEFSMDSIRNVRSIDVLNAISQQIPDSSDVIVDRLVVSPEHVLLTGNADTFNTVNDIRARLEKNPLFAKVTIPNMEQTRDRISFKLKLQYKP